MTSLRLPSYFSRKTEVLDAAEALVLRHSETVGQRRLLSNALQGLRAQLERQGQPVPFVHLPLLVYGALRGDDEPAIPLAAATTLLYLGADILDDLQDGDLQEHWRGYRPAEISLAAATLLCAIVPLAITELDAPASTAAAMHGTLAKGLLRMSAGQQQDLAMAGSSAVSAAEVEKSVAAKSGEELATFASLAALLAGAAPEVADLFAEMARAMGTAGQLASDCNDLFVAAHGSDLANGTRTLPIAMHLDRSSGEERLRFLEILDGARTDALARETVRSTLRAAGVLWRCAFTIEVYCQRARRDLKLATPREPASSGIQTMIDSISFFSKGALG